MNAPFFHTQLTIRTPRLVLGLLIGLAYSFSLYGLLVVVRETIRIMSYDHVFNFWVLNEEEVNFYNLFYAFIAVIFGQSACFSFWTEGMREKLRRYPTRQVRMIHDQRFLNFSFLMWFGQLAFLYGLFFSFSYVDMNAFLSFYPQYGYIFVLLILVLFLQSWVSIRLVFKRGSLRWMFLSAVFVTVLSFGLSKIPIVDNKELDAAVYKGNLLLHYSFDRPGSDNFDRVTSKSLVDFIYIGMERAGQSKEPVMIIDNKKIHLSELPAIVDEWFSYFNGYDKHKLTIILFIDKQVPTHFIVKVKKPLQENGVTRIGYGVEPIYNKNYHANTTDLYFPWRLLPIDSGFFHPDSNYLRAKMDPTSVELRHLSNDSILFDGNRIGRNSFQLFLSEHLRSKPGTTIRFYINESLPFVSYFSILSESMAVIDSMRNEEAFRSYGRKYDHLNSVDAEYINNKYPFRVHEMSEEMVRRYETPDSLNYTDPFGNKLGHWQYYKKGKLWKDLNYLDNELHGKCVQYFPDGVTEITHYTRGKRDGFWQSYEPNARTARFATYWENGQRLWMAFPEILVRQGIPIKGFLLDIDSVEVKVPYVSGKLLYKGVVMRQKVGFKCIGTHHTFYESGGIKVIADYDTDVYEVYDEAGKLIKKSTLMDKVPRIIQR